MKQPASSTQRWSPNRNEESNLGSVAASHQGRKDAMRALKFMEFYTVLHYLTTKEACYLGSHD